MKTRKQIGKRLRKIRKEKGLTLKQLAEKIGVIYQTVSRWEKGDHGIPSTVLPELCEKLNILPSDLLEDIPKKIQYPYLAKISAGEPILANKNIKGLIELDTLFPKGTQYCFLKVKGDSLKDSGIINNDCVIIDTEDIIPNEYGIYAVAIFENDIENAEATLKKIKIRENTIALIPANPEYEIKLYKKSDIRIVGKVVRVIKKI